MSEGQKDIFRNELLVNIGKSYQKTAAQVILRWHIQRGIVVIPNSSRRERMVENMQIWDFELAGEDMAAISMMDIGYSEIIDHHSAGIAKWINEYKIHD